MKLCDFFFNLFFVNESLFVTNSQYVIFKMGFEWIQWIVKFPEYDFSLF